MTSRVQTILDMSDDEGHALFEHIRNGKWDSELVRAATGKLNSVPRITFEDLTKEEYRTLTLMFLVAFFARSRWPYKHDSPETMSLDIFIQSFLKVFDTELVSGMAN